MAGKLLVVGAGLMGAGIAQVAAVAGYDVTMQDLSDGALRRGRKQIHDSLARLEARGRVSAQARDDATARVRTATELEAAAEAEIVVEAVFEDLEIKRDVFRKLDKLTPERAVLATNTSAIPITSIAAATGRPEAVVGTHFFSPVPMMALCELVRGHRTSEETLVRAKEFAESCGKTTVVVQRDIAGFVTTRLIAAVGMEAARLLEQGVISAEDLDTACRLGFGWAMGPLATSDLTGIDVLYQAAMNIYRSTRDPKFLPPESVARMVEAGDLGRKTGRGFFTYEHQS
ncbi:MAG TPA: 3-hydroxyacyl-CoA dehydrogenase family protein [Actinomycetes bacterium]|nr:3-hydroxyacyl-CoA dehydrogenase family protein [Actinomycetes bacterium]